PRGERMRRSSMTAVGESSAMRIVAIRRKSRVESSKLRLPEVNRPEENRPEVNRPEVNRPEVNRPEANRPEVTRPEENRPEVNRPGVPKMAGLAVLPEESLLKESVGHEAAATCFTSETLDSELSTLDFRYTATGATRLLMSLILSSRKSIFDTS